jgi:hypothetical protein
MTAEINLEKLNPKILFIWVFMTFGGMAKKFPGNI